MKVDRAMSVGWTTCFEVETRRAGRWAIEKIVEDTERVAIDSANRLLKDAAVDAIRVSRIRSFSLLNVSSRVEILVRERPKAPSAAFRAVDTVQTEQAGMCSTPDDLLGIESRMVIGHLLRPFLDEHQITQTELLHHWPHQRLLERQGPAIQSGCHQVAAVHARMLGTSTKERASLLHACASELMARARRFAAEESRLPPFTPNDLEAFSARLRDAEGERHDYLFLATLSTHLASGRALIGKLDTLTGMAMRLDDPRLFRLLDGVMADTLSSTDVVRDFLGENQNLGDALGALGDLLGGRLEGPRLDGNPLLASVAPLLHAKRLPLTRVVLIERLVHELRRDHPLRRNEPEADLAALRQLVGRLCDRNGYLIGGTAAEIAIGRRCLRARQVTLRREGLHDIADTLPATWSPDLTTLGIRLRDGAAAP